MPSSVGRRCGAGHDKLAQHSPLKLIHPPNGTVLVSASAAMIRAVPHPNAARLFQEFIADIGYSQMARRVFSQSLRSVPLPEGLRPAAEVTLIAPMPAQAETGVCEV